MKLERKDETKQSVRGVSSLRVFDYPLTAANVAAIHAHWSGAERCRRHFHVACILQRNRNTEENGETSHAAHHVCDTFNH